MARLPEAFETYTRQLFGTERYERFLRSLDEEAPISIRLNPQKAKGMAAVGAEPVPWCRDAYYLPERPAFTMDPLLHAGCYYVQEAASMFLDEVLRQTLSPLSSLPSPLKAVLDLCAAPGGKSTLLRAALPADCTLFSNEPVRQRASILAENVQKWGSPRHIVTNNYPKDYRAAKLQFDIILCDVPCSGEGMFRKDPATIGEWSPQQVEKCQQLQHQIVDDAWACLNDGGLLIYSTCTFNTKENEENISYFLQTYDARVLPVETRPEWNVTGSLLTDFTEPVYRFIPGTSRSEGLFLCVLQKGSRQVLQGVEQNAPGGGAKRSRGWSKTFQGVERLNTLARTPDEPATLPTAELDYAQAVSYLRGEALQLAEDTPRGEVTVCFHAHPLGPVKNIGNRANNLYPKPWRIKTTHIPHEYEPILKQI